MTESIGSAWAWTGFIALVFVMLAIDLGVFHRREHEVRMREALIWSAVWIGISLGFNLWIWLAYGAKNALLFLTGYFLEKAMSVDNLFVFLVIFSYFSVPKSLQHRVLFWGVLGALAMRAGFIFLGLALIHMFTWVILVLGVVLLVTGIKMLRHQTVEVEPERNPVLRLFRRLVPATTQYHGTQFMVVQDGRRLATPLALVLVVIETTDLAFAIDSIPAIIGITQDPFLVFTSNIFAILGLRSLYFVLAGVMDKFRLLGKGLGLTLVFIAIKMLVHDYYDIPIWASLGAIGLLVGGAMVLSVMIPSKSGAAKSDPSPDNPAGPAENAPTPGA